MNLTISRIALFLVFSIASIVGIAQPLTCDDGRYIDNLFTDIDIQTDIFYGEGVEINGTDRQLFLDVYQPVEDNSELRPLIVVAFGGSFITGARQDLDFLCQAYASKGYVVATIDYRLYDGPLFPLPTALQMTEVVIKSVADMKGAIRYLRSTVDQDNPFKIDPNLVFAGGISAGAITAMHTAVLDSTDVFTEEIQAIIDADGGLEGTVNDLDYESSVSGVINFSGGLADASWIDESDPPFVSIHDEFDGTVPYETGFAAVFGIDIIYMEGSKSCALRADSLGLSNELFTIDDSQGHVSYFENATAGALAINRAANFIGEIVCENISTSTLDNTDEASIAFPNPTSDLISWDIPSDVMLYDARGQVLRSAKGVSQMDVSTFVSGQYLLRLVSQNGNSSTQWINIIK